MGHYLSEMESDADYARRTSHDALIELRNTLHYAVIPGVRYLYACPRCGCPVPLELINKHEEFHESLSTKTGVEVFDL